MGNITLDNEKCVKIAVNKSLLKEFTRNSERAVYLENGTEFQIQIFNPYDYTIGASISINGKKLQNLLVIKPGQRIWLERYLNEAKKFLFETYEVNGNSEAVKKAIANNGVIEVSFHKEKESNKSYWIYDTPTRYYPSDIRSLPSTVNCFYSHATMDSITYGDSITTSASTTPTATLLNTSNDNGMRCLSSNSMETGRVEKGSHSDQKFYDSELEFEWYSMHTEKIHLLPMSQKTYNANDLKKIYCSQCGRKLNTKYKFCPYCGARI